MQEEAGDILNTRLEGCGEEFLRRWRRYRMKNYKARAIYSSDPKALKDILRAPIFARRPPFDWVADDYCLGLFVVWLDLIVPRLSSCF
jgi:hypothetical protein